MYKGKRFLDLIFSIFLIFIFLLPMILIYLIIILIDGHEPIYYSKRIGIRSKLFIMPKFRTMKKNSPQLAKDKIDPDYVTKVGKFLRITSLDELPQLFLVFSGKMSIVGPRPALYNQYYLIKKRKKLKIDTLKTGITGYAQINGRDRISLDKKILLDNYYFKNMSFFLDIKIIFYTFFKVIGFRNISH
jgi:O-antigen biosynthesis protein WbqP